MRRGWALGTILLAAAAAHGQPPSRQWHPIPPGTSDYFGSPIDDQFTPNTLAPLLKSDTPKPSEPLPAPAELPDDPTPSEELPPPTPQLPSARGDGLFPSRQPLVPPAPPLRPLPPPPGPPKLWSGSGDIGLNGANGNSNLFNGRTTWHVSRKSPRNLFVIDLQYAYLHQDSATKQNQAILNSRDEILFPGDPWSAFSALQVEYDELRAYRFRVGEYAGAGYKVVDNWKHLLRLRLGAGATRELGYDGARNQWVPEAVLGHDLRYRFDDRNSFASVLDFYPRIDRLAGQYRVRARVAYESVLDPKTGTIVRFGVQDRYDSNPANALRNDLTYFATLGLKF